jgi:hypothetical protein
MKLKVTLILLLTLVFGGTYALQTNAVQAGNRHTPTPISSPVTSPISGPITFAGLKLQGKVTYRIIGRWWKSLGHVIGANDVTVVAKNRETGEKTETQTNVDGEYTFILSEDKYKVYVAKDETGWFVPSHRNVNLKKDKDGINFHAVKWNNN